MSTNLDETELARLEYLIEASESCGYSTKSDDPNMQYLAAACHYTPALVAEVRRLREALNKEHRAWQCADARGDWLEMENTALREKVEAWKWFEECFEVTQWLMANGQTTPESRLIDVLSNSARVESLISTNFAREAVHADR